MRRKPDALYSSKGHSFIDIELFDEALSSLAEAFTPEPGYRPRPTMAPHCDCFRANKLALGTRFRPGGRQALPTEAFDLCPTKVKPGSTDVCAYCGYTTCLRQVRALSERQLAGFESSSEKNRLRRSRPVVGKSLVDGSEVSFPSAQAAYEAGWGSVNYAIKKCDGVLKGMQWRLA